MYVNGPLVRNKLQLARLNFVTSVLLILLLPFYPAIKLPYISLYLVFCFIGLLIYGPFLHSRLLLLVSAIGYSFLVSLLSMSTESLSSAVSWILLVWFLNYFILASRPIALFQVIIAICILYTIDSIIQFVRGVDLIGNPLVHGGRASGPFIWHSPVIGGFLMVLFFLPEYLRNNFFKYTIYGLFLITIILAGTRGALLQVLFCFFVVKFKFRYKVISIIVMFLTLPLVASLASYFEGVDAITRVLNLADLSGSIAYESRESGRIAFWKDYLLIAVADNIIFGAGLGSLEAYLLDLTNHYIHPHHLYLEILLTFGIVGSIPIVLFLYNLYGRCNENSKLLFWSFWGPFNALHSVFDFYWAFMMFLSLGLTIYSSRLERKL